MTLLGYHRVDRYSVVVPPAEGKNRATRDPTSKNQGTLPAFDRFYPS
jgi:hypothetical protein